ncbi:MAG: S8 family serine peptidase [Promethearchaeota archaeon]
MYFLIIQISFIPFDLMTNDQNYEQKISDLSNFGSFNNYYSKLSKEIKNLKLKFGENNIYLEKEGLPILVEKYNNFFPDLDSKFGVLIQQDIENLFSNPISNSNNILETIILFHNKTPKIKQLQIIKELNWFHNITKQFKIIPGIVVRVNLSELSEKTKLICQFNSIYKLFKDASVNINENINSLSPQYSAGTNNWWLEAIGANNITYNGSGINIAILDTGISKTHIDLNQKDTNITHKNFVSNESITDDYNGHGTHVAAIAAGTGQASDGKYSGVAPNAKLYNLKVANASGSILSSDVINAVQWCTENGINIISMSFGSPYAEAYNPETVALTKASELGIISISAAGNSGPQFFTCGSPAAGVSVISVGAINKNKNLADFSSEGPSYTGHVMPDILAPGVNIISAEEKGSLLSNYMRYTDSYIDGSRVDSNYIPLSGTSMSCPMVAGAVALILQAFPYLTPEGVRIALYNGAYIPNELNGKDNMGDNGIGAGILNVSASIKWLESQQNPYNLVGAFPNNLPVKPFDLLKYPGDQQYMNLSVFSGANHSIVLNISLSTPNGLEITTDKNQIIFLNNSVDSINVGIKISENSSIGNKTAMILLQNSLDGSILEEIHICVEVIYPRGRIYFESFHGLNDLFPQWPTGFKQIDIYKAMKHLHDIGYKLDYKMDDWTFMYNSSNDAQIITPDKISLADVVVLQTPVLPYNDYEINVLKNYLNLGGSILILGTKYQALSRTSINKLLTSLNTGIIINDENIFNYTDLGIGLILDEKIVGGDNLNLSSPVFSSNDEFKFWFGPTLSINNHTQTNAIASLNGKDIIAAYEGELDGKGNVVVWSDYHWLRNDIFHDTDDPSIKEKHENILENLFSFLNTRDSGSFAVEATLNPTQESSTPIELDISVLNITTNLNCSELIPGNTINASLIYPNGNKYPLWLESHYNGIYSNSSFFLGPSSYSPYTVEINVTDELELIQKKIHLFNISYLDEVILLNPKVDFSKINRTHNKYNSIEYSSLKNNSSINVTLYGALTPINIYNLKSSKGYEFQLFKNSTDSHRYKNSFNITGDENSGRFVFYAMGNTTDPDNHFFNFNVPRSFFSVINFKPQINEQTSLFNGHTFNSTNKNDSYYINQVSINDPVLINMAASEKVPYEDDVEDLNAVLIYSAVTSVNNGSMLILPNEIPHAKFRFSPVSELFTITFNLSSSLEFNGTSGVIDISQESTQDLAYLSVLWLTIRDTEGAATDYLFLLYINIDYTFGSFLDYMPIIILFLIIIGVVWFLYGRSGKNQEIFSGESSPYYGDKKGGYYDDSTRETPSKSYIYCMYCGRKIESNYTHCPYCGKEI